MKAINETSDQDLLLLLRNGDHAAFTELYHRYWEKLLLIAWNHTKDKGSAEDIVHEVFVSLWNLPISLPVLNVGGFLATKIKFAVFENYRKEQRRAKLAEANVVFHDLYSDEERLDALFLEEYIKGIVAKLPERCRLVFKYSRELGMKNAEIAAEMNITEKGVEANITRALKIIRNNLEITSMLAIIAADVIKSVIER